LKPLKEYETALTNLREVFGTTFALFEELKQATNQASRIPPEQRHLVDSYYNTFASMQQKLEVALETNEESSALNASTSFLSSSLDINRTLEMYSSMLVEAVKEKLQGSFQKKDSKGA
jgi:hypothetical protein